MTYLLPRIVCLGRALHLSFIPDPIDARESERIGLVTEIVPDEDLLDQVYDLDVTMVDEAEWLLKAVDEVLVPEKDPAAAISEFLNRVEELHRRFDRRSELLQGLGPGK